MTTTIPRRNKKAVSMAEIPLLYPGDHLTQEEFHRRYEAYPDDTRFELIGGIVYMMAPAGFEHGSSEFHTCGILYWYAAKTPGVVGVSGATVLLGEHSEPEPDAALLIMPEYGGQTTLKRVKNKHYIQGPPELVLEVSHSTVGIDLHAKREDYRVAGVLEYVVVCLEERAVRWFDLPSDAELKLDRQGVLNSRVFPGLWIHTKALLARDLPRLSATLEKGLESAPHRQFVQKLAAAHKELAAKSTGGKKPRKGNVP
jgi:Uma2 family endonuclease